MVGWVLHSVGHVSKKTDHRNKMQTIILPTISLSLTHRQCVRVLRRLLPFFLPRLLHSYSLLRSPTAPSTDPSTHHRSELHPPSSQESSTEYDTNDTPQSLSSYPAQHLSCLGKSLVSFGRLGPGMFSRVTPFDWR